MRRLFMWKDKFIRTRVLQSAPRFTWAGDMVMGQQMCSLCSTKEEEEKRKRRRRMHGRTGEDYRRWRLLRFPTKTQLSRLKCEARQDLRSHALSPTRTHTNTTPQSTSYFLLTDTLLRGVPLRPKIPDTPAGHLRRECSLFSWPNSTVCCVF